MRRARPTELTFDRNTESRSVIIKSVEVLRVEFRSKEGVAVSTRGERLQISELLRGDTVRSFLQLSSGQRHFGNETKLIVS